MVGTLVGACRCALSRCNLDMTFDLVVVTFTFKILSGLFLGNCKVWEVDTWLGHWLGCRCTTSWYDLDLTLDLAIVTLRFKILSGPYLRNCND